MKLRLLFLAAAFVTIGWFGSPLQARMEEDSSWFNCHTEGCPGQAQCEGTFYFTDGCKFNCVLWYGGYNFIPNGTADCNYREEG